MAKYIDRTRIEVRMTPAEKERLYQFAKSSGLDISHLVRSALKERIRG